MFHLFARPAALLLFVLILITGPLGAGDSLAQTMGGAVPRGGSPAATQPRTGAPPALAIKDAEALVKTLENDAERKKFVQTLKDLIAAQKATQKKDEGPSFLALMAERVETISSQILAATRVVADAPLVWSWIQRQANDPRLRDLWVEGLWKTIFVLLIGLLAELLAWLLLRRPRRAVEAKTTDALPIRATYLFVRTILDVLPIGAFAAAAYTVLPLLEPSDATARVALTIILANVIARAIRAVARMLLTPKATSLRILSIRDETAAYLFVWIRRLTNVIVYSYFLLVAARAFGLPQDGFHALLKIVGVIVTVMLIVLVLQNRKQVREWMEPGDEAARRRRVFGAIQDRVADIWHVLAVLLILAAFIVWVLDIEGGFEYLLRAILLTAAIVVIARVAVLALAKVLMRIFRVDPELQARNPNLEARANRYLTPVQTGLFGLVHILAAFAILMAWGVDIPGWLATELGRRVLSSFITIIFIIVAAVVFWEVISTAIERYLARLASNPRERDRSARMRTLLPLVQKAILATLVVVVALIVLSELGVNIGPLLAGAGVIGLAIGFGAQTLVKDIITGVFNLIEDTIAIGDVVTAGGHTGVVEDLSIRSVVLRDYSGVVHTVPFSSVTSVENMTKDYSYYVFDFGVAYREDIDAVTKLLREVGAGLRDDPDFAPNILADLEIAGLQSFGDSAIVIRARIKTLPGAQWGVGREMNRRVKIAFDANGIEIPFPHQTIYFGEDKQGKAPPAYIQLQAEDAARAKKAVETSGAPSSAPSDAPTDTPSSGPQSSSTAGGGTKSPGDIRAERREERRQKRDRMDPGVMGEGES